MIYQPDAPHKNLKEGERIRIGNGKELGKYGVSGELGLSQIHEGLYDINQYHKAVPTLRPGV